MTAKWVAADSATGISFASGAGTAYPGIDTISNGIGGSGEVAPFSTSAFAGATID